MSRRDFDNNEINYDDSIEPKEDPWWGSIYFPKRLVSVDDNVRSDSHLSDDNNKSYGEAYFLETSMDVFRQDLASFRRRKSDYNNEESEIETISEISAQIASNWCDLRSNGFQLSLRQDDNSEPLPEPVGIRSWDNSQNESAEVRDESRRQPVGRRSPDNDFDSARHDSLLKTIRWPSDNELDLPPTKRSCPEGRFTCYDYNFKN
jgi:hypothetical protein